MGWRRTSSSALKKNVWRNSMFRWHRLFPMSKFQHTCNLHSFWYIFNKFALNSSFWIPIQILEKLFSSVCQSMHRARSSFAGNSTLFGHPTNKWSHRQTMRCTLLSRGMVHCKNVQRARGKRVWINRHQMDKATWTLGQSWRCCFDVRARTIMQKDDMMNVNEFVFFLAHFWQANGI